MRRMGITFVAALLAMCMLCAGCAQAVEVTAAGELPIVNEPVTLTLLTEMNARVEDFATNECTKWVTEQTGIELEWEVVGDINVSKAVILASGDYPDVFLSCHFTQAEIINYGVQQGIFAPLNDLIEQYGYYYKQVIEASPYIYDEAVAPDGNVYGLGHVNECYHMTVPCKMWVNSTWLDNLGIETPTTTDEFYAMLKAFKEQDANGNGDAGDEIPLTGIGTYTNSASGDDRYYYTFLPYIMDAFIVFDPRTGAIQPFDGTLDTVFDKEEFREGLRYIAMLYSEGLIDPEFASQDDNTLKAKIAYDDGVLVGAFSSHSISAFADLSSDVQTQYDPIAPLVGPEGVQGASYMPFASSPANNYVIASTCENKEAAFRLADFLYCDEATYRMYFGREGIEYRVAEEGEVGINGEQALYEPLISFTDIQNVNWNQQGVSNRSNAWRLGQVAETDIYKATGLESRLYQASEIYRQYTVSDDEVFPINLFINEADNAEYAQIDTALINYVSTSLQEFITGKRSLDSDWDAYVAQLEAIGLSRYEELLQAAYDVSGYAQ